MKFAVYYITFLLILFCSISAKGDSIYANVIDTNNVYGINEVLVVEQYDTRETRSTAPLQILTERGLKKLNALQVSDAIKHFSGVTVKDYGGIGGLKTVSVRSLGAGHTAVSYDGITLSDCQSGQIDIGRFSLDNINILSLANGQGDKIFQPARQIAAASLLNITTLTPKFTDKPINGKLSMKGGSFGMLNPALYIEGKLSDKLSCNFGAEWMSADGEYPYTLEYGDSETDSVSNEVRKNTDVKNLRLEGGLFGEDSVQSGYVKFYYYESHRGLPGATIFYNTANFSSQRIKDRTAFVQAHYERALSAAWSIQANAKYNYGFSHYIDPSSLNSAGKVEDIFHQHEAYGSVAVMYRMENGLSFAAASDIIYNKLDGNTPNFAHPSRLTSLTSISGKYVNEYVIATISGLFTAIDENVKTGNSAKDHFRFSPYASISVRPVRDADFRIRLFYKNIFRMPTFNDLYYSRVGNSKLSPEKTNQVNLGVTYQLSAGYYLPLLSITCDAYYNDVKDKIVALPTKNLYTWTMLNYGRVAIGGVDLNIESTLKFHRHVNFSIGASYTYNYAVNVTDKDSREYGHQIPYTPRISGSGKASLETTWFTLSYSMLWSGARYSMNQNFAENRLPAYTDHSLSLSHTFDLPLGALSASVECLNIANNNYSVIKYFPMPGRSFRASVAWRF